MSAMPMHGFFFIKRKEKYVKTRIALWDNLKFLLIMLVVIGHFMELFLNQSNMYSSLSLFIYTFHMPLFLFVSGLFHKNKNVGQKCIFFISVGFIQKMVFAIVRYIIGAGMTFSFLSEGGIPWFMFVLSIYTLITYLLRNQNKEYICLFSIMLACFVGYDKEVGDFLCLSRILVFYPIYLLGTIVSDEKIKDVKKNKWVGWISLVILIAWLFICFYDREKVIILKHLFTGRNCFAPSIYSYGAFMRLLCYIITFFVGASIIFLMPSKKIKWISAMGERTIDVYFWHWPVYMLLNRFFHINKLLFWGAKGKVVLLLIAVIVTFVLSQGGIISYPLNLIKSCCYKKQNN